MPSAFELLARICGTRHIRIRLASDVFAFSQGESRSQIRPVVWFERADASWRIVAVGDQPPPTPSTAVAVDLVADRTGTVPVIRERGLGAVLRFGIRSLPNPARIPVQRPEVVFEDDEFLAPAFSNEQRHALTRAVTAAGAVGCRFE
jgi:hypothetical protein